MDDFVSKKKTEKKQHIWVERYRPSTLSEYIGNEKLKETFQIYINQQNFCNILLHGKAGVGKTTLAKLLVKEVDCDYIYINASDERGIDVVRDKIKNFASTCGFKNLKVIILDEIDFFTPEAQASLRSIIETFSLNTRFILTCNYHEKISSPIISRVQSFEILPPSKKDVALKMVKILENEKISFVNEDLVAIINTYYPDIRKIIQILQQFSLTGKLQLLKSNLIEYNNRVKIVEMLKNKSPFIEFRKYVLEQNLSRYEDVYQHLYENIDSFASGNEGLVILKIADAIRDDAVVANKSITFLACIYELLKILK